VLLRSWALLRLWAVVAIDNGGDGNVARWTGDMAI